MSGSDVDPELAGWLRQLGVDYVEQRKRRLADGGPVGYVMTDCPHPVYGGPPWHVGPCRKCEKAGAVRRRADVGFEDGWGRRRCP